MKYVLEPILNSELILVNNSKDLEKDPSLYNDKYLQRIEELRDEIRDIEMRMRDGEKGLQKKKRAVRDELRELSSQTYVHRDANYLMKMVLKIIDKIASRPQFSNYTFLDEMKSLAVEHILLYSKNFDANKQSARTGQYSSAFAYISTAVFNAFVATINKFEKEQEELKKQFENYREHHSKFSTEHNNSTLVPEFEDIEYEVIKLDKLRKGGLLRQMKKVTIHKPVMFIIPKDYKITEKDLQYIEKYTIGIKRHDG